MPASPCPSRLRCFIGVFDAYNLNEISCPEPRGMTSVLPKIQGRAQPDLDELVYGEARSGRRAVPMGGLLAHPVGTVDATERSSLKHRMNYPPRGIQNRQTYGRID